MKQLRLAEALLEGYGISPKSVRPTQILDIIDGLLINANVQKSVETTNRLYNLDCLTNIEDISFIAKDPVLVKLLGDTKATKLYTLILTGIILGTNKELPKAELDNIFGDITNNSKYRALGKAVESINSALDNTIILYSQYADKVVFIPLKGETEQEFKNNLAQSGYQSPVMIDKLHSALIIKGII